MLKFRRITEADREILKNRCRDILHGTESFTCLSCLSHCEELFWCGVTENDEIKALIINTGDGNFTVFGDETPDFIALEKRCTMVYRKNEAFSENDVTELENSQIAQFYKKYSSASSMGFDDMTRYVNTLHCKNKGFCKFFGIKEKGSLISVAAVVGVNDKFSLIGNVFTVKEKRGQGFARKCVEKCIEFSVLQGKIPVLYCDENMTAYYKGLGFEEI